MSSNDLIGRRVLFAAWEDVKEIPGTGPVGTVTHVIDHGAGAIAVQVQVAGQSRHYTFALEDVEFLPLFYTLTPPEQQGDRIRLYPSIKAARADAAGRPIFEVAFRLDPLGHRLASLWTSATLTRELAPEWTTPAELHHDDSITAKGPIPAGLFGPALSL